MDGLLTELLLLRVVRSVPATSVRDLSRQWTDALACYRRHRNDEHLEALVEEAVRYAGMHLENDLASSSYWSKAPLARRVAVLLFLVDRRVVERRTHKGHCALPAARACRGMGVFPAVPGSLCGRHARACLRPPPRSRSPHTFAPLLSDAHQRFELPESPLPPAITVNLGYPDHGRGGGTRGTGSPSCRFIA